jgi:hypothetical protein
MRKDALRVALICLSALAWMMVIAPRCGAG